MNLDIQHFKALLVKEKETLEKDLGLIGRKIDPSGVVWENVSTEGEDTADREDVASAIETFENNEGAISILETQLHEVNHALEKMEKGTYGICEVSDEEIEAERLEANPSARTCKKHL
jgi:RNA polymerase-binding transcription factor DksA